MSTFRNSWMRHAAAGLGVLTLVAALGVRPAWAPGSLSLQDVLDAVKGAPKLVGEINSELKTSGLDPEKVVCWAARHGNHWKYLGGGRAAPYECTIGKRTLTIEAETTYFDAKGRSLGDVEKADPRRAKTFQERKFRWSWAP